MAHNEYDVQTMFDDSEKVTEAFGTLITKIAWESNFILGGCEGETINKIARKFIQENEEKMIHELHDICESYFENEYIRMVEERPEHTERLADQLKRKLRLIDDRKYAMLTQEQKDNIEKFLTNEFVGCRKPLVQIVVDMGVKEDVFKLEDNKTWFVQTLVVSPNFVTPVCNYLKDNGFKCEIGDYNEKTDCRKIWVSFKD